MDRLGFVSRLREAVAAHGKHTALAHGLGVSDSTISRWVSTGGISLAHFAALCEELGVSADWLLFGRKPAAPLDVKIRGRWSLRRAQTVAAAGSLLISPKRIGGNGKC